MNGEPGRGFGPFFVLDKFLINNISLAVIWPSMFRTLRPRDPISNRLNISKENKRPPRDRRSLMGWCGWKQRAWNCLRTFGSSWSDTEPPMNDVDCSSSPRRMLGYLMSASRQQPCTFVTILTCLISRGMSDIRVSASPFRSFLNEACGTSSSASAAKTISRNGLPDSA